MSASPLRARMPTALLLGLLLAWSAGPEVVPAQTYPGGGDGIMYIGTYDGTIHVLSETTGQLIDRIPTQTGIPRDAVLNQDGTRFYVLNIDYERLEVIDIASKETLGVFSLSEGTEKARISSFAVNPAETRAVLVVRRYERLVDRWEIGPPELLVYDLQDRSVVRSIEWPGGEPRRRVDMRFSDDGRSLYFFMDDIRIYETENFTEVDRWAYQRSLDEGMGSFDFGFPDSPYREEGTFTGLFEVVEPVNERELMGVARVDLSGRRVDFFTLGPAEDLDFTLGPDGRGYGLHTEIGNHQLWTFDLEERRVVRRIPIQGRTRMELEASSNGRYLYVWQAGNTIDLLDPETGRYVYTIELDADTTTDLIVVSDAEVQARGGG